MGNFSRNNTFNGLNNYIFSRLQKGVPLLDADWNENLDIISDYLRNAFKLIIGDGVPVSYPNKENLITFSIENAPDGNVVISEPKIDITELDERDNFLSFLIQPLSKKINNNNGKENDDSQDNFLNFEILAPKTGRGICFVDGWEIFINKTLSYQSQDLFDKEDLATKWKVDPVKNIKAPQKNERKIIYLDAWNHEIDPKQAEEKEILTQQEIDRIQNNDIALNQQTCVRFQRRWVVRIAEEGEEGFELSEIKRKKS